MASPSPTWVARLSAPAADARRLAGRLGEILDADEVAVSLFEAGDRRWTIALYFRHPPHRAAVRALIAAAAGDDTARRLRFERLAARDWVKTSLAGLPPVAAGRFLVHGAHDRARVPVNTLGIEIEAALAFGTGHHGSTRGCLEALAKLAKRGRARRALDLGTGSGVLAIAAAKIFRTCVLASDIDARAVEAARGNARRNRAYVEAIRADGVNARRIHARAPFDLIFANILARPLTRLAAPLARLLAPGGRAVLSGLLPGDAATALAAYRAQGLALERRLARADWVTLILRRGRN